MRVISGIAGGRKLKEIEGYDVRPTTDKVKESVFNIVQFSIEGRKVLDLFAGTGQLGIEAISRGAKKAIFVDQSTTSIKTVRENVKAVGFEKQCEIVQADACEYLRRGEKFDLIFLDPPYDSTLLEKALQIIEQIDILNKGGIIVCESRIEKVLPELKYPYEKFREYKYGKIRITTFCRGTDAGQE